VFSDKPKEHRIIKIGFDKGWLEHMMKNIIGMMWKQGKITLVHPLPEDISLFDVHYDRDMRRLELYLESENFEPIPEGAFPNYSFLVVTTLSDHAEECKLEN
jgi:hypothetical protein